MPVIVTYFVVPKFKNRIFKNNNVKFKSSSHQWHSLRFHKQAEMGCFLSVEGSSLRGDHMHMRRGLGLGNYKENYWFYNSVL